MQKSGVDVKDITLIQQAFDMNGFLAGDIDAAQAMTYNEYAQVLETKNPATGELFKPEDLNVINWNDVGTAMLQDAIWANSEKLSDPAYADQTTKLIKASIKGWVYARDNPEEAAKIVADAGSTLGESHQLWMTNEINKLIWPSTSGHRHDLRRGVEADRGHRAGHQERDRRDDHHQGSRRRRRSPPPTSRRRWTELRGRGRRRRRQGLPADHRRAQGGRRVGDTLLSPSLSERQRAIGSLRF